jgi:hypothetical protein
MERQFHWYVCDAKNSNHPFRRDHPMNRLLLVLAVGSLSACTLSAQTAASVQASAPVQSQTSAQSSNSGVQASTSNSAAATSTAAASAPAAAGAATPALNIPSGTNIDATLATSLDAKRSKPGDDVEARTEEDVKEDGKVVMKKGTHLVGHVTQAQARAKGQTQSQLGIVFDRAVLKNGQEVPVNLTIQALAAAQSLETASAGADEMMSSSGGMGTAKGMTRGGGLNSGVVSTAGTTAGAATGTVMNTAASVSSNVSSTTSSTTAATMNTAARSAGAAGGLTSTGRLASDSSGVFGLQGLSIDSAASSATQGSMIVSTTKNVHLDSGTQMLLRTSGQAQ